MRDRRRAALIGFLVLGTALLGLSFRIEPGSAWFYPSALALAATWAVGAFASGPVPLGERTRRCAPCSWGCCWPACSCSAHWSCASCPVLDDQVSAVTAYADRGTGVLIVAVTLVTGVAEELFFRGSVYAALPTHPVAVSTLVYALVTLATGNIALVAAAAVLGLVVGLERRSSGGVLAPAITHVTWSLVMLLVLPQLF